MAISSRITCASCGAVRDVMHSNSESPPKMCSTCRARQVVEKRDRHFEELRSLSVEERLQRIEEWIYDYRPTIPLSQMRF